MQNWVKKFSNHYSLIFFVKKLYLPKRVIPINKKADKQSMSIITANAIFPKAPPKLPTILIILTDVGL